MPRSKNKYNDIFLEIGTEPLPANSIYSAIKQLKNNTQEKLEDNSIVFDEVESFDTYRRLVVLVKKVKNIQEPPAYEIRGPSKEIAFDENNKPTKAFFGFLKKTGLKEIDVNIKKTDEGEYIFGLKKEPAKKVETMLPDILKQIVNSIKSEKNMRWNKNYGFIRPIRWILALYGDKEIGFEIAGVKSNNFTFGHQVLYPEKIEVRKIADYFKKVNKHNVILDFHKRRQIIEKGLNRLAKEKEAELFTDKELLDELSNLTEYPSFLIGTFNKKYLELPDEVIMTSLKEGQKLFALKDKRGKVENNFLAVIDNKPSPSVKKKICSNYESILDAKLKDSVFFLKQDTKTLLSHKVEALKELIFQRDLGSMHDKMQRLRGLSLYIAGKLNLPSDKKEKIDRCAYLSKADLTTQMVSEFPTLEGLIGYKYALISGEEREVAEGIYEHYKPKSQDDEIPKSIVGTVCSLSDKLDTLCSCFSIGLIPTGSYDPYALRRNALGWVRIVLGKKFSLSIDELIDKNLDDVQKINSNLNRDRTKKELKEFLKQRLKQILTQGKLREDLIDAALLSNYDDFVDVVDRIEQLRKISKSKRFFQAYKVVERTNNILKKAPIKLPKLKPKLLKENLEKKLWKIYNDSKDNISELIENKKYRLATEKYADDFFETLHIFFDKVMVNVDNEKIRNNRLSLMKLINRLYTEKVADLSLVNF